MSAIAAPAGVRFEHRTDDGPVLGVGTAAPRLSWIVPEADPSFAQEAYEVEVTRAGAAPEVFRVASAGRCWCRGRRSRWRRARRRPCASASPETATSRTGASRRPSRPGCWTPRTGARASSARPSSAGSMRPRAVLRASLDVPGEVTRARLYATAHGVYEVELNGARVGDHVLAPGWTGYPHRLRYQTFDVTALLARGRQRARRAARRRLVPRPARLRRRPPRRLRRPARPARPARGRPTPTAPSSVRRHRRRVARRDRADRSPTTSTTARPTTRARADGWSTPGFDDAAGRRRALDDDLARLVAPDGPAGAAHRRSRPGRGAHRRRRARRSSTSARTSSAGCGSASRGAAGAEVTLRHAEVLEDGELGTRPLRTRRGHRQLHAARRRRRRCWEPRFTFHGFRYAEIDGWPATSTPTTSTAVVVPHRHGAHRLVRAPPTRCSTGLHENVVWSMRGNFLDVPTDCPQRDERLGWTGDIQVFAPTAALPLRLRRLPRSWLADLAAEQDAGRRRCPSSCPDVARARRRAAPRRRWGDAAVIVPWVLYERFGDAGVLRAQFAEHARLGRPGRRRWPATSRLWDRRLPVRRLARPGRAARPARRGRRPTRDLVATAYLARSAELVAERGRGCSAARDDAARYARLAAEVRGRRSRAST